MKSPAMDLKDVLVTASIGTFAGTSESAWNIYIGFEPISPPKTITIYDTGGDDPNAAYLLDFPTIQIRVRGPKDGYQETYSKAWDVKEALLGIDPFTTTDGTRYDGVWAVGDLIYIGLNEDRPIFVVNFRIAREPSAGTYRTSL